MNNRAKGLQYVREVKKILIGRGYKVEGPGYATAFFKGRCCPVHRDYFSVFDLMSHNHFGFSGHQVSTLDNKAVKVKALRESKIPGFVWGRIGKNNYRVFLVDYEGKEEEMFMENI